MLIELKITKITKTTFLLSILLIGLLSMYVGLQSVSALEYEAIDSFDVHPINRWTVTNSGFTGVIDGGRLKLTDIGDGSSDSYLLVRELRDLDGSIELKFMIDANSDSFTSEVFVIGFGALASTSYFRLRVDDIQSDDYSPTSIEWYDVDNNYNEYHITGNNRIHDDIWYILTYKYDWLLATIEIMLRFENGSQVFRYKGYNFLGGDVINQFVDVNDRYFYMQGFSYHSSKTVTYLIDYVNAPFKEREWKHTTIGGSSNWLVDETWESAEAQDNIDESQVWRLTIPRLDLVSAIFQIVADASEFADSDNVWMIFRLYCVDADDGGLHEAFEIGLIYSAVTNTRYFYFQVDGVVGPPEDQESKALTDDGMWVSFAIGTRDDRSILGAMVKFGWDSTNLTASFEREYDIAVSEVATDPSSEFVCEWTYDADFDTDMEFRGWVSDWNVISKDSMMGMDLGDARAAQPADYYDTSDMGFWGGLSSAFSRLIQDLGNFITKGFDDILGPIIEPFQDWIEGVITFFLTLIGDFIDAAITWIVSVSQDIIDLGAIIFFGVYDGFWEGILGLDDAPDFLAIFGTWGGSLFTIVFGIPQFTLDLLAIAQLGGLLFILGYWLWAMFLGWASERFDALAGLSEFIERMTRGPDITVFGIGPFRFMIGWYFMFPLTMFLIIIPTTSFFGVF